MPCWEGEAIGDQELERQIFVVLNALIEQMIAPARALAFFVLERAWLEESRDEPFRPASETRRRVRGERQRRLVFTLGDESRGPRSACFCRNEATTWTTTQIKNHYQNARHAGSSGSSIGCTAKRAYCRLPEFMTDS